MRALAFRCAMCRSAVEDDDDDLHRLQSPVGFHRASKWSSPGQQVGEPASARGSRANVWHSCLRRHCCCSKFRRFASTSSHLASLSSSGESVVVVIQVNWSVVGAVFCFVLPFAVNRRQRTHTHSTPLDDERCRLIPNPDNRPATRVHFHHSTST